MTYAQQALAKAKKDLERNRSILSETKNELVTCNSRLDDLEEYATVLEKDMDKQQMEWERQQEELDATLVQYETERDQIYNAAISVEVS
jgi:chromosome segregation ATPase